jgi:hypothetical protein
LCHKNQHQLEVNMKMKIQVKYWCCRHRQIATWNQWHWRKLLLAKELETSPCLTGDWCKDNKRGGE